MIKSVARAFRWPPKVLSLMYVDEIDIHGLVYWYNDAVDQEKEIRASMKSKD